jgi:RNA polymerase sigma-70 factor (ECF subfamily)
MPYEVESDDPLAGPALTNEEVYSKYAGELIRFATGLVGPWDAEDVLSGAVISAMYSRHWPTVKNPRAYLYRSVLNEALQAQRSAASRRVREIRTASRDDWDAANQHPEVLEVVRGLSIRQRAVIVLTYWNDLDTSQVARLLAISEGAVKRHLARARAHLRKQLQSD